MLILDAGGATLWLCSKKITNCRANFTKRHDISLVWVFSETTRPNDSVTILLFLLFYKPDFIDESVVFQSCDRFTEWLQNETFHLHLQKTMKIKFY